MLRVGLTGGIGSGKSTVAARFRELGALVIDADVLAREVVAAGSEGLVAVVERFGPRVLTPDGSLDRPALGALVFADAAARRDLERITHPRIAALTADLLADAPAEQVVVHDVPLLVEKSMGAAYHLVVVVDAEQDVRVHRLVDGRGVSEDEARSRMAAQATDRQRRRAADVWLDNNGAPERLLGAVDRLWRARLVPFNANLLAGQRSRRPVAPALVPHDPTWPDQAARLIARIRNALGDKAVGVQHIGSTSVPGLAAKDVIDLQVGVGSLAGADEPAFVAALADAGFPRVDGVAQDRPKPSLPDPAQWRKRFHASADPGRAANLHVREIGSAAWRFALLFPDWLGQVPAEQADYEGEKRRLAGCSATTETYAAAKEPWFDRAHERALEWAERTGWTTPAPGDPDGL